MDELAAEYGFSYTVSTAGIDEKAIREPDPRALVVALAHAKADAIIARLRSGDDVVAGRRGVLITCDQVVVHMGRILEKPEDEAQASQRRQRRWRRTHAAQAARARCTRPRLSTAQHTQHSASQQRPGNVRTLTQEHLSPGCVPQAREYIAGYGTAPASTVSSLLATDLESGRRVEAVDVAEVRRYIKMKYLNGLDRAAGQAVVVRGGHMPRVLSYYYI
jgi:hydrogenase maturation factor